MEDERSLERLAKVVAIRAMSPGDEYGALERQPRPRIGRSKALIRRPVLPRTTKKL
jgi:hypothetical protein